MRPKKFRGEKAISFAPSWMLLHLLRARDLHQLQVFIVLLSR